MPADGAKTVSTSVAPPALSTVSVSMASEKVKVKVSVALIVPEASTSDQLIESKVGSRLSTSKLAEVATALSVVPSLAVTRT